MCSGRRSLGILACTNIGGSILYSGTAAGALFVLDMLGVPRGTNGPLLLLLFPASYLIAGWDSSRLIKKNRARRRPRIPRRIQR